MFDAINNDPDATLAALDADYARLLNRQHTLSERKQAIREATIAIIDGLPASELMLSLPPSPSPQPTLHHAAALALLDGVADLTSPQPVVNAAHSRRSLQLGALQSDDAAIDLALSLLAEPLRRARRRAASVAWERASPAFRKALAEYSDAVIALDKAAAPLAALARQLNSMEVGLPVGVPDMELSPLTASDGRVAAFLRDAINAGFMDRRKVPATFA